MSYCRECGKEVIVGGSLCKICYNKIYIKSPADLPEAEASAERISSVVRSLPDYNEIDQVANDEANGIDWNELKYSGIYTDGFIAGALWMKNQIKQ